VAREREPENRTGVLEPCVKGYRSENLGGHQTSGSDEVSPVRPGNPRGEKSHGGKE